MSSPPPAQGRLTRSRRGPRITTATRADSVTTTGVGGLANTRTRIVGARTGALADLVVAIVRFVATAGAAIGRIGARVAAVVTPLGWVMVGVIPAAFVGGYALGWVELVVVGWAGLVLVVIAAVYLIGRSPVEVTLVLPHRRVVVADPARGAVTLRNPTGRRVLGVKVEIPVGVGLAELAMPSLRGGASFTNEFAIPTLRRGVIPVGPVRTVRADPIGLVRRELIWTDVQDLVVHPRTVGVPSTSTGLIRDLEGTPTRDLTSSDVDFQWMLRRSSPCRSRRRTTRPRRSSSSR